MLVSEQIIYLLSARRADRLSHSCWASTWLNTEEKCKSRHIYYYTYWRQSIKYSAPTYREIFSNCMVENPVCFYCLLLRCKKPAFSSLFFLRCGRDIQDALSWWDSWRWTVTRSNNIKMSDEALGEEEWPLQQHHEEQSERPRHWCWDMRNLGHGPSLPTVFLGMLCLFISFLHPSTLERLSDKKPISVCEVLKAHGYHV